MNEIRQTVHRLIARPGFSLLAVAALALGIGGTTAVYSLVHHVLLGGLPYEEPDRIVTPDVISPVGFQISLSVPYYRVWSERSRMFESWGASSGWSFVRPGEDGSEILNARLVLGDFFATLGMRPVLGRLPAAAETERGADPVVVLGHGYWQRAFGGDPGIIGKSLVTDRFTATIIGVLPQGAGYPNADVETYVPMGLLGDDLPWDGRLQSFGMRAVARLAPGATLESAQADLDRIVYELETEYGETVAMPELRTLEDLFVGDVRARLWMLLVAVGLVLLIACANVANLALARGEERTRELALRAALGAGRGRLVTMLLTESALLAIAGGVVGVAVAAVLVGPMLSQLPLDLPGLLAARVAFTPGVLVFAGAITLLSAALFGLLPALRLGLSGPAGRLYQGGRSTAGSGGREGRRLLDSLVVTQVALSVVLLIGAGLLFRSLQQITAVEKGFDAEDVLTARLQPTRGTFTTPEQRHAFYEALAGELTASPDVVSAAATQLVPLVPRNWERVIAPEGASLEINEMDSVLYNVVTPDYFETLGIPLLQGRVFDARDRGDDPVAIIDLTMAERFWPGEDPIGQRVTFDYLAPDDPQEPVWLTVIGVVPNVRHYELENPSRIQVYVPMRQAPPMGLSIALKHRPGTAAAAAELLRRTVADLEPGVAVFSVRPLRGIVADALGPRRALGTLTLVFAGVALALAAFGIFSILSLVVSRRRRELGVRMAVGASASNVLRLVARYGLGLVVFGSTLGILAALGANRLIGSLLYEVRPFDPLVYLAVAGGMFAVAAAATLAPALRAARTDPARVLREE